MGGVALMDAVAANGQSPLHRPLFLSPHLDDAVFGCGRLLASLPESTVLTVFAGGAPQGLPPTEWDRAGGFQAGDDVVAARRDEDRTALAQLGAHARWLGLPDRQYAPAPSLASVLAELRQVLADLQPDAVFFPLGLFHDDHRLTRDAAIALLREAPGRRWFAWADALYRALPGELAAGLAALADAGLRLWPVRFGEMPDAPERKARAVRRYRSQLRALATPGRPGLADLAAPESYWQVVPLRRANA